MARRTRSKAIPIEPHGPSEGSGPSNAQLLASMDPAVKNQALDVCDGDNVRGKKSTRQSNPAPPRTLLPKRRASGRQDEDPVAPQSSAEDSGTPVAEQLAPTVSKSKKRVLDTHDGAEDVPGKKPRRNNAARPRSPLPKRRGRNEDPVGKHAKAAKVAAKKADKAAKVTDQKRKEDEADAAKDMLAEMEVDESFTRQYEHQRQIRRQSDMGAGRSHDLDDSEEPEEFANLMELDFSTDISETDGESSAEPKSPTKMQGAAAVITPAAKGKKKLQPKLRDQIAEKKKKLKVQQGLGVEKGGRGGKNLKLPTASGLNVAWLASSRLKKGATEAAKHALNDEAAQSTRPDFPLSPDRFDRDAANTKLTKANKRNPLRKNELAAPIPENHDTFIPSRATGRRPAPREAYIPLHSRAPASRDTSTLHDCAPTSREASIMRGSTPASRDASIPPRTTGRAPGISKLTTTARLRKGPTQQARQVSHPSDDESSVDARAGRNAVMPKGSRVGLLTSVLSSSKSKYFATLLAALFASEEPFEDFLKTSPVFLVTCCTAFESVWPYLNVSVETDDVLFNVGSQRVVERRGKIHDAVKTSLQNHFASQQYSPADIMDWVDWFCTTYGSPVFYETPIPQDGVRNSALPGYKKPRGFLKSKFMIDIGTRFLQEIKDSSFDFGPPRGLFVLILTAYEKVARSYKTGVYVPTGDFCGKWCNVWVRQYNKNFDKDNDWWSELLEHYNVAGLGRFEQADISTLDEGRAALPMSSSP